MPHPINALRRRFLASSTKVSAAFGALLAGMAPDVRAMSCEVKTLDDVALTASDCPACTPAVASPVLDLAQQNVLYSQGIGDADVRALAATIGPNVRVDPPVRSYDSPLGGNGRAIAVVLPLTMNEVPVGFVYYGSASVAPNMPPMPVRLLIASDGKMLASAGGFIGAPDAPELAELLFAAYFTKNYVAKKTDATVRALAQQASPMPDQFTPRQQQQQAPQQLPQPAPCVPNSTKFRECLEDNDDKLQTCINNAVTAAVTAGIGAILCALCIWLTLKGKTPGKGVVTPNVCFSVCGGMVVAGSCAWTLLNRCVDQSNYRVGLCWTRFMCKPNPYA